MITQHTLKNSPYFNGLGHIAKTMICKKVNLDKITLGVNMSTLQSFDFWVDKCNPTERVKQIVKELIKK